MSKNHLDELFTAFRNQGDLAALEAFYEATAPALRRLARRLSSDPDQAEDAVQDTYLELLRGASSWDASRPVLPWLMGVLGKRVLDGRRRLARQRSPEQLAEELDPREVARPDELTAVREAQGQLQRAIGELPASLRDAVSGRWLEGRSTEELALALGVSSGALRVRIHRGLARLKSALPRSLAGLLALLGLRSKSHAATWKRMLDELRRSDPSIPAAGTTVLLGSRMAWLVLALVSAGWFSWRLLDTSREAAVAPLADVNIDDVRAPVEATVSTDRAARSEGVETEEEVPWRIAARVLLPDSTPVADHPLRLNFDGEDAPPPMELRTDQEGRAVFEVGRESKLRTLQARTTPQLVSTYQWLRGRRSGGGDQDLTLIVGPGGSISGVVLDEADRPVPGALVKGWCGSSMKNEAQRKARADDEGRFTLDHLGESFWLIAETEDKVRARGLFGKLRHGQTETGLELRIATEVTWEGEVHTPAGRAVEGAKIFVGNGTYIQGDGNRVADGVYWFHGGSCRTESDAEGRFTLEGLPPRSIYLQVTQAPFLTHRKWYHEDQGPLSVELDPGLGLQGEITTLAGAPALDARVRFYPYYSNVHNAPRWSEADDAGHFEIKGMSRRSESSDPPTIAVVAPGYAAQVLQPVRISETGLPAVGIVLEKERRIRGRVIDETGRPLADVSVRIEGDRLFERGVSDGKAWTWERAAGKDECRTADDGTFLFDSLYAGSFAVRAYALHDDQLFVETRCTLTEPGDEAATELVLNRSTVRQVVLKGCVVDAHTSRPVQNFKVMPYREGSGRSYSFTDRRGQFEVVGLAPGAWELQIDVPGYVRWKGEERKLTMGEHEYLVELIPARELQVRVVDAEGDAVEGAKLQVLDVHGEVITLERSNGMGYSSRSSLVFQGGELRVPRLPRAPLTLRVLHDFQISDHPIDLRTWNDDSFEIVVGTVEKRSVVLAFFEAGVSLEADEDEVEQHWKRARDSKASRDWVMERLEDGRLRNPQHAFRVRIDSGAVEGIVRADIEPRGEVFRIQERGLTSNGFSSSDNEVSLCHLWVAIPVQNHAVYIDSDHYPPRSFSVPLEEGDGDQHVLVLLR